MNSSDGATALLGMPGFGVGVQLVTDHPELDAATYAADAVLAVEAFHRRSFGPA